MDRGYEVIRIDGTWYLFDDADDARKKPVREANSYVKRRHKSQNSRRNALYSIKFLYDFLDSIGIRHPSHIRQEHLGNFRDYMLTAKKHRGDWNRVSGREGDEDTWNSIYSNVKNYITKTFPSTGIVWEDDPKLWIPDDGIPKQVTKNMDSLKGKDIDWGTKAIAIKDFARILSCCTNSRDRLIFEFLYQSGIRIGELFNIDKRQLESGNIDRNEEFTKLYIHHSSSPDERKQTKSGDGYIKVLTRLAIKMSRYIELEREENRKKHHEIFTTLKDQIQNGKVVSRLGDPLSYSAVYQAFKEAARKSCINATIHDLRHSYAMNRLIEGVHVKEVQDQLRHKNLSTTSQYTKGLGEISPRRREVEFFIQNELEEVGRE